MSTWKGACSVSHALRPNSKRGPGTRLGEPRAIASTWLISGILLSLQLTSACARSVPPTPNPTFIIAPPTEAPSATAPGPSTEGQGCYYVWSTQELPDLGTEFESRLKAAFPAVQASAYAFGEDCRHPDGTSNFLAMEADLRVRLPVESTSDEATLGDAIKRTMAVVEELASANTGGPRLGRVEFEFNAVGMEPMRVNVEIARYRAEAGDPDGAALFRHFRAPP